MAYSKTIEKRKETFIEKANKKFDYKYDYSKVDYKDSQKKVEVVCNLHGSFFQAPHQHLQAIVGCPTCGKRSMADKTMGNTQQFIERSNIKHNNFYNYSKVDYKHSDIKVIIICPTHGEFLQVASTHLRGHGCSKCADDIFGRKTLITQDEFIKEATEKHKGVYNYSKTKYIKSDEKVTITCIKHGDFEQNSSRHLKGHGCPKCGREASDKFHIKTQEQFIIDAQKVHGNTYSYLKTEYENSDKKIIIICKLHGEFEQKPRCHLSKQGCKKCAFLENGGYGRTDYIRKAKGRICTFYTLKCFNEEEEFYKIGITLTSVEKRYPSIRAMPYNYEVILEIKGEAGFIWDLEASEKKKLKKVNYQPAIEFGGSKTECFTDYKI